LEVQVELVLLGPNTPLDRDLVTLHREPPVGVVERDLHEGIDRPGARSFMKKRTSLLNPQVGKLGREDKLDGGEEVGLARPVTANHHVVPLMEGPDNSLVAVGLEPLDGDGLDVHGAALASSVSFVRNSLEEINNN
jgi:hypothetical protein